MVAPGYIVKHFDANTRYTFCGSNNCGNRSSSGPFIYKQIGLAKSPGKNNLR
jgi:hypothetical protein